jgi:hypothetical protein
MVEYTRRCKMNILETFKKGLPNTLYLDPFQLSSRYPQFTENEWDAFLSDPETERLIKNQLAKALDISARQALFKLMKGQELNTGELSQIKETLSKSKMLQEQTQHNPEIIFTAIPDPINLVDQPIDRIIKQIDLTLEALFPSETKAHEVLTRLKSFIKEEITLN